MPGLILKIHLAVIAQWPGGNSTNCHVFIFLMLAISDSMASIQRWSLQVWENWRSFSILVTKSLSKTEGFWLRSDLRGWVGSRAMRFVYTRRGGVSNLADGSGVCEDSGEWMVGVFNSSGMDMVGWGDPGISEMVTQAPRKKVTRAPGEEKR